MTDMPWLDGVPEHDWLRAAAYERDGRRNSAGLPDGVTAYRAPADRPRQRRSSEDRRSAPRVCSRIRGMQLRASDDGATVAYDGYATVYDAAYEMWDFFGPYTEKVSPGAGAATLARADLDVPLVLQHADLRRIARTTNGSLELAEDDNGLHVSAPRLELADVDVAYIVPKLRSGLIDEMSFRFMITKGSWSSDWTEYHIEEYDIHRGDVAIVGYGANPHTAGSGLRAAEALLRDLSDDQARRLLRSLNSRFGTRTPSATLITDEDVRQRTI